MVPRVDRKAVPTKEGGLWSFM